MVKKLTIFFFGCIVILILAAICFLSCKQEPVKVNQDLVEFTLLNDTVYYVPRDTEKTSKYNYQTLDERSESCNKIRYRVMNYTNKKYLFFLRDIELIDIYGFNVVISNSSKTIEGGSSLITYSIPDDPCFKEKLDFLIEEKAEQDAKLKKLANVQSVENFHKFISQTVVIYPGESSEFSSLLSLPIPSEEDIYHHLHKSNYYFVLEPEKQYQLNLDININDKIKESIPEDELKDLTRNNIEIFTGKLSSNKVILLSKK